jgi:hypothetical protein
MEIEWKVKEKTAREREKRRREKIQNRVGNQSRRALYLTLGWGSEILWRIIGTRAERLGYIRSLTPSQIMLTVSRAALLAFQSACHNSECQKRVCTK